MNRAWHEFYKAYLSVDRRVLGAFRIVYGLVLLYDLARRAAVLELMYSNDGVLSNHYVMFRPQADFQLSLLDAFSTPSEVMLAFALIGVVYVLYTLGLFTRLTRLLALVCLTSLNSRNLFVEDGGVSTLIALGVWTQVLPVGQYLSLDALRVEANLETLRERVAWRRCASTPAVSLAVLALALQLCAIYWLNAAHKTGATWHDGEAVHYILWQRRVVTDLGYWLAWHEPSWLSPLATYGTLVIEWMLPVFALYPFGVWPRVVAFAGALALHGGIALTMTLGPFSYAMLALVLLRLPWPAFQALGRLVPRGLGRRWARARARLVRALRRSRQSWARLNRKPPREARWRRVDGVLVLILAYAAIADMGSGNRAFPLHLARPRWVRAITGYPRFLQRWNMFAPDAPVDDGAGVVDAVTRSGRHVDPFSGEPPNFDALDQGKLAYGSIPADYLFSLHFENNEVYRQELTRYLREWHQHEGRKASDEIVRFEFWWLSKASPAPGRLESPPTHRELVFRGP
ncbi:MAG TPA: hypothetical protein VMG12_22080 [Polyangiaceae bacterium]|nr:hypothetical protein [Polyangiaceae bacterium]